MGNPLSTQGGFDTFGVVDWYYYGKRYFGQEAFDAFNYGPPLQGVDMSGDVCVVTGANSGLGYSTALELAKAGAKVHMVCRNKERGETALEKIKGESKNDQVALHIADMSCPKDINAAANEILKQTDGRINVVVNNAGVLCEKREVVKNEDEKTLDASWATMVGGSYLLTGLFRNALIDECSKNHRSRVIDVSSGGHYTARLEDKDPFGWNKDNPRQAKSYRGDLEYGMNKRAQVYLNSSWARFFQKKCPNKPAPFMASMHPGWSHTLGVEKMYPAFYESNKDKFRTQEAGADTIVWLAGANWSEIESNAKKSKFGGKWVKDSADVGGQFWLDREPQEKELCWTFNAVTKETEAKLWALCEEWTGQGFEYAPRDAK